MEEVERNVLARDCRQAEKLMGISGGVGQLGIWGDLTVWRSPERKTKNFEIERPDLARDSPWVEELTGIWESGDSKALPPKADRLTGSWRQWRSERN